MCIKRSVYSFALCSTAPSIREIGLLVDLQDLGGLVGLTRPWRSRIGLLVDLHLGGLVGLVGARRSCTSRGARAGCARRAHKESSAARVHKESSAARVSCRPLPLSSLARNNANHSKLAEAGGLQAFEEQALKAS